MKSGKAADTTPPTLACVPLTTFPLNSVAGPLPHYFVPTFKLLTTLRLVRGYLLHRPLSATLAIGLVALGTGLLSLLLLLDRQLTAQFDRNLAGVDLVIGAKGSPLQLVTSTLYHADNPTGNIPVASVTAFANPRHPLIQGQAVPLALGDSYRGRRIVGTTDSFFVWYDARVAVGRLPAKPYEVAVGARAAQAAALQVGATFRSAHGLDDNPDLEHADSHPLEVVGVLAPTDLVIDGLIVTPVATVWGIHGHHGSHPETTHDAHEHDVHEHDVHEHHAHEHDGPSPPWYEARDESVTAVLAKFSGRNTATLNFARNLNENTDLMAATPPVVMAQFSEQVAGAEAVVRALGGVVLGASVLSLLVILLNALRERMGDLQLLRSLGATPVFVFGLVLAEGVVLAALGTVIGLGLGRVLFYLLRLQLAERYPVGPLDLCLHDSEPKLVALSLAAATVAAALPAWRAYRVDVGV